MPICLVCMKRLNNAAWVALAKSNYGEMKYVREARAEAVELFNGIAHEESECDWATKRTQEVEKLYESMATLIQSDRWLP